MAPLPPVSAVTRRTLQKIVDAIRKHKTFFLTGHQRPDGDTIGSELALGGFLKSLGKKVTLANREPVPDAYLFLPGARSILSVPAVPGQFDVAFIFECSGPERMGHLIDLKGQAKVVINIDHHSHHSHFGHINLIDPKASSNSEQLCHLFATLRHRLSKEEATALYVGLVTDTGRFQQENTRSQSHSIAAHLLEAGVDVAHVYRRLYATRSVSSLQLMSRALGSLRLFLDQRVSVMRLTRADFQETGAKEEEAEDVVNQGLLPATSLVSVFFRELDGDRVKVSLRGKGLVDLCRLAVSFGGGGHKNASGVTLSGTLNQVESKILGRLRPVLSRHGLP